MRSGSGRPRMLLDTKPLIKLFAREEGWEHVQKILSQIEVGGVEAAVSVVTLTEIYYGYLQEKRPDLAKARIQEI
ncbi:MAG: PIN domain-containing protein, partial [Candidatus Bathyarchaeia archaeon]